MKDPLDYTENPYDILELSTGASNEDIESAFLKSMESNPKDLERTMKARNELQDSFKFSYIKFFSYNDDCLEEMSPNPLDNSSVMNIENRLQTAIAWQTFCQKNFNNIEVIHSLALIWYWWAKKKEEDLKVLLSEINMASEEVFPALKFKIITLITGKVFEDQSNEGLGENDKQLSLLELWKNSAIFFGTILGSVTFWKSFADKFSKNDLLSFKKRIIKNITDSLDNGLSQFNQSSVKDSDINSALLSLGKHYDKQASIIRSEFDSVKHLESANIYQDLKKVICGKRLMEKLHITHTVKALVQEALLKKPDSTVLKSLLLRLSPFFKIRKMLDQGNPMGAISEISNIAEEDKESKDLKDLIAEAYFLLGEKDIKSSKIDSFASNWILALKNVHSDTLRSQLTSKMVNIVNVKASSLAKTNLDKAIALLQKSIKIIPNYILKNYLAQLMAQRSINKLKSIEMRAKQAVFRLTTGIVRELREEIVLLDEAVSLGNKDAINFRPIAEDLLNDAKKGLLGLSSKHRRNMQKALEAKESRNIEDAISLIEGIVEDLKSGTSEIITYQLSSLYVDLARKKLNTSRSEVDMNKQISDILKVPTEHLNHVEEELKGALQLIDKATSLYGNIEGKVGNLRNSITTVLSGFIKKKEARILLEKEKSIDTNSLLPSGYSVSDSETIGLLSLFRWVAVFFLFVMLIIAISYGGITYLWFIFPLVFVSTLILKGS